MILPWIQMIKDLAANQLEFPGWLGRFGFYFRIVLRAFCLWGSMRAGWFLYESSTTAIQPSCYTRTAGATVEKSLSGDCVNCVQFRWFLPHQTTVDVDNWHPDLGKIQILRHSIAGQFHQHFNDFPSTSQGLCCFYLLRSGISQPWMKLEGNPSHKNQHDQKSAQYVDVWGGNHRTQLQFEQVLSTKSRSNLWAGIVWVSHPVIPFTSRSHPFRVHHHSQKRPEIVVAYGWNHMLGTIEWGCG